MAAHRSAKFFYQMRYHTPHKLSFHKKDFVVLKGSHISPIYDDTLPSLIKELRKTTQITENQELLEDKLFNSPSYAAIFVIVKSANGLTSWKTKDGKTLKDLENVD